MSKKLIVVIIAVVLAVALLVTLGAIKSNKEAREKAQRQAEEERMKIEAVTLVVMPFAEMYGFDDIVCNAANLPHVGNASAVFTSEKFGKASDEDKLRFISDVGYYSEQLPYDPEDRIMSIIADNGLSIKIISGEYSYAEWVTDGLSQLRRAEAEDAYSTSSLSPYKETIFSMETLNSVSVEAYLKSQLIGVDHCKKCNATDVLLSAGGYCNACIDTYFKGEYISWFNGQAYFYPDY